VIEHISLQLCCLNFLYANTYTFFTCSTVSFSTVTCSTLTHTTGRAVCPTAGTEGRATIPKFTTGSFTKIVNYRATGSH
jgi:hypothetical protein